MRLPGFFAGMFPVAMMVLGAGVVSGQTYPDKSIRIVTTGVGGGADFAARLVAQGLTGSLGQTVVVDNRPSGVIPGEIVSRATPDGYTLLLGAGSFTIGSLMQDTPYDPVRDFLPITLAASSPAILVVHPSMPVKSVKELIALAKAKPGELNYASQGAGGLTHLAAELFKSMTGVNIMRINYKGAGTSLNDLIGGQVQLMFAAASAVTPHVKSGGLRALAVTSIQTSALAPGLPTVAASGVPGYESIAMFGMFAPAKTPETIINRLNQEIVRVLNQPEVKQKFFETGTEVVGSSPEQLAAKIKAEMARMGKVIKDAGIRVD